MSRIATLAVLAAAAALVLGAVPARAQQAARVFVAAQGSDTNPCTFALPCRSLQRAHDAVAAKGEIDVLDPAGYGSLIISKAISIQGHGFAGVAQQQGFAAAITISAGASDKINLRGLLLDGLGTGIYGIFLNQSAASLNIQQCVIRHFGQGVVWNPAVSSRLAVSHTSIADNDLGLVVDYTGSGFV